MDEPGPLILFAFFTFRARSSGKAREASQDKESDEQQEWHQYLSSVLLSGSGQVSWSSTSLLGSRNFAESLYSCRLVVITAIKDILVSLGRPGEALETNIKRPAVTCPCEHGGGAIPNHLQTGFQACSGCRRRTKGAVEERNLGGRKGQ